jgi:hypothetical protein
MSAPHGAAEPGKVRLVAVGRILDRAGLVHGDRAQRWKEMKNRAWGRRAMDEQPAR